MSLIRGLKQHLSFLIPLVALLFGVQTYLLVERSVENYEKKLNSGYAIIIASEGELKAQDINGTIKNFKELTEISAEAMLNKIKEDISSTNYALLKVSLPKFYKITLESFPNEKELQRIEDALKKSQKIKKVETFSKSHSELYMLLSLAKVVVKVFAGVIFITSFMLMLKQIEVWRLTHAERMSIMELFGSPYWMKSAALFKFAIVDSFVASAGVSAFFIYVSTNGVVLELTSQIGIGELVFNPINDGANLLGVALCVSLISVIVVISSKAKEW